MDQLLALSTDPYIIGGIFLFVLIVLHYVLVFRFPLTLKQWKLAEYVWVGLALISMVGLLEEARFLRANQSAEVSRANAEQKLQSIENWFDVYRIYACEEVSAPDVPGPFCQWVDQKYSDFSLILANEGFPPDLPQNLLGGIENTEFNIGSADREIIKGHLATYIAARMVFLDSSEAAKRSMLSALLVSLVPILFAIAIALKFSKVTGEYRLTGSKSTKG